MALTQDPTSVAAVLAKRAARTPRTFAVSDAPGSHVWAASGLVGWPGSSPTNVFAQSGLRDAFADIRAKTANQNDWVSIVANSMKRGT